jgi:transcriptional regulator with XRE-family HTH domain
MVIGEKLKTLRAQKNLSQGDIEKRTGLLRCYNFKNREWAHRPLRGNSGEDGPSVGSADVPVFHGRRSREEAEYTGRIRSK